MTTLVEQVTTAAGQILTARDTLVADTAKAAAVVHGPSSGSSSVVDLGTAGNVKTLSRVMREAAGRVGLQYKFAAATDTSVTPGAGKLTANNVTLASATEIAIATADVNGLSHAAKFADYGSSTTVLNRGVFYVQKLDGSVIAELRLVGAPVSASGFYRFPISVVDAPSNFAADDDLAVLFIPTGDRGGNNYTWSAFFPGDALPAGDEPLIRHQFEAAVSFSSNFPGCKIATKVAPSENAVYHIYKHTDITDAAGTLVGTVTIPSGQKNGTFSGSSVSFAIGNFLEFRAPTVPVANIRDLTITLTGTQSV